MTKGTALNIPHSSSQARAPNNYTKNNKLCKVCSTSNGKYLHLLLGEPPA